jgi:hypothetical protein
MKAIFSLFIAAAAAALAANLISPDGPLTDILEAPLAERLPEHYQTMLPEGMPIPDRLPRKIEDPFLLSAWIYLYNQTEPIQVQDNIVLSGRSLAEYLLKNNLEVSWGSDEICNGNSCSRRPACLAADCVEYYTRRRKMNPIYIAQRYRQESPEMLVVLAGSLAHEAYHHHWYFGPLDTTLFEEYWAYKVGAQIRQDGWGAFDHYDPTNASCLQAWHKDQGVQGYYTVEPYPFTLETAIDWDNPCNASSK